MAGGPNLTRHLYLVRHGETLFNVKGLIQGWCDSPLTDLGWEQARRAGAYLEREGVVFDHAYASTLTRTQRTLECITGMPYSCEDGLREWYFGTFEAEHSNIMFPKPWGDFFKRFGGEGQMEVRRRMVETLTEIMRRPGHERVLAVSSGSSCREFLAHALGYEDSGRVDLPGNCSIMLFSFDGSAFSLDRIVTSEEQKEG